MTIVVVAFAFLAQSLLALGPVSCGQQLRPCCGGPNQVLVVVVTDLKCRMTATRISSAPPRGAYESFARSSPRRIDNWAWRRNTCGVCARLQPSQRRSGATSQQSRGDPSRQLLRNTLRDNVFPMPGVSVAGIRCGTAITPIPVVPQHIFTRRTDLARSSRPCRERDDLDGDHPAPGQRAIPPFGFQEC